MRIRRVFVCLPPVRSCARSGVRLRTRNLSEMWPARPVCKSSRKVRPGKRRARQKKTRQSKPSPARTRAQRTRSRQSAPCHHQRRDSRARRADRNTARGSRADTSLMPAAKLRRPGARAEQLEDRRSRPRRAPSLVWRARSPSLSESIHYAGGNCVANCVHGTNARSEKQQQVEIHEGGNWKAAKATRKYAGHRPQTRLWESVYDP